MVKKLTVAELLKELDITFPELKQAFERCALPMRNLEAEITAEEKQNILAFFKEKQGYIGMSSSKPGQVKRRMLVQVQGVRGRREAINVEVRKKRSYPVKPLNVLASPTAPAISAETQIKEEALSAHQAVQVPESQKEEAILDSPRSPSPVSTPEAFSSQRQPEGDNIEAEIFEKDSKLSDADSALIPPSSSQDERSEESPAPKELFSPSSAKLTELKSEKETHIKSKKSRSGEKSAKVSLRRTKLDLAALEDLDADEDSDGIFIPSEHLRSKLTKNSGGHDKKSKRPLFSGESDPNALLRPKKSSKQTLQQKFTRPAVPVSRHIRVHEGISVQDLAEKLSLKSSALIKELIKLGIMARLNDPLESDVIELLSEGLGHQITIVSENILEETFLQQRKTQQDSERLEKRAPIVTVMGHVDHGKTSLLDFIRKTRVASSEFGGITQHLGAYRVDLPEGSIVFIDTPGHQAFTMMRARGAKCTDIVILVVAADDGIMSQTEEAIQHAKAANAPIIVAITKSDKPAANPAKIKEGLLQHELVCEEWGGDVQVVEVSSATGAGMDNLLQAILLQAELLNLLAPISGAVSGVILESKMDKGKGPAANVLIQKGTLKVGDLAVCGQCYGRVRQIIDEFGKELREAGPAMPITLYGLTGLAMPNDLLVTIENERQAKELTEHRRIQARNLRLRETAQAHSARWNALNLAATEKLPEKEEANVETVTLNVVIKTDTHGTLEALKSAILSLNRKEAEIFIRGHGVGAITEGDIALAQASQGILIAFNVRPDASARKYIEQDHVKVLYHSVIYEVIEAIKAEISGRLSPIKQRQLKGIAEVRAIFRSPKFGVVAGCLVTEGVVTRKQPVRIVRDSKVILEGELDSLRRGKEDVTEVRQGTECGIGVKNYSSFLVGDRIEVYEVTEVARTIFNG